jgi:hypothetical protein
MHTMNDLYDTDVALWSEHHADLLRRRAAGQLVNDADLDWSNIAEEIEALGRSECSNLRSLIDTVIEHLINLQASLAVDPRRGWIETAVRARGDIAVALEDTHSLRRFIPAMLTDEAARARRTVARVLAAHGEQPRVDIGSLTFTEDQVLGDWFSDEPA